MMSDCMNEGPQGAKFRNLETGLWVLTVKNWNNGFPNNDKTHIQEQMHTNTWTHGHWMHV